MTRKRIAPLTSIALAVAMITAATALAACDVPKAEGAPPAAHLALMPTTADCDTTAQACYILSWTWTSDGRGIPDGYIVTISRSGGGRIAADTADGSPWPVRVTRPAIGQSLSFDVAVVPIRRGLPGDTARVGPTTITTVDVAPPAVTNLKLEQVGTGTSTGPDSGNPNPPTGDVGSDSLPSSVGALFVEPRDTSPHFDHIRRTYTDYCGANCWDGARGAAARAWAAKRYDLIMSGSPAAWAALNPTITQLRYALAQTTLSEEPDTNGRVDENSITGKWQQDAREWFARHPEYDYEALWLHDQTPDTPADSAHRLRFLIWKNYRFALNPLSPGARAYTIDRLRRSIAESGGSRGLFLDEMDHNAWRWLGQSREGAGMDSLTWHAAVVDFVRMLHDSLSPAVLQSNAAGYSSKPFDAAIGMAAGNMHLEKMLLATQDQPTVWDFIDKLLANGTDVDFVAAEVWVDFLRPSYATSYPAGNYALPVYRGKVFQLASYYMVVDSLARHVGIQSDNTRGFTPDSVDLRIYYLDVGHPKAKRYVWQQGKDALGQAATVYRRDFDHAVVLIRPITSYKYPKTTDTTAVSVALPVGGPWSMVTARGELVPLDSLELRNSEAVILVRRE